MFIYKRIDFIIIVFVYMKKKMKFTNIANSMNQMGKHILIQICMNVPLF